MFLELSREVYVTKIEEENYEKAMSILFDNITIKTNKPIEKICVKINLCDYRLPSSGATTDYRILGALLKVLRLNFADASIYILENDASGTNADDLFSLLDISETAKRYSCETVNLAKGEWITKKINGRYFDSIEVPKIIEDCDLFINHPKLKTHSLTKVTVSLKNMYGCLRPKYKAKYHGKIDDVIIDINKAIRCDCCIVDGNICLEGIEGPTYGTPKKCGLLIGGTDIVSVDSFCAKLMGFNPWFVPHIRKAHFSGLGSINYRRNVLNIESFKDSSYKFKFNLFQYYIMQLFRGSI